MSISNTGCSVSITKVDLEHKYKSGFADGAKAVCSLILGLPTLGIVYLLGQ